jgi:hypothetical protein
LGAKAFFLTQHTLHSHPPTILVLLLLHSLLCHSEGLMTNEVYPNGISTSLPYEVQQDFIRSIKGFENTDIRLITPWVPRLFF